MHHILDIEKDIELLYQEIFPQIAKNQTILFLGAGASVGKKKYLSNDVMKLYSNKHHLELDATDITEYVDILSADSTFNREDFDEFVTTLLEKLEVTSAHTQIARLPWREIITTNYDLLIEKAFDMISNTSDKNLIPKPVRDYKLYSYNPANDEVKYVKLHGCISDRNKYPLTFSSKDFDAAEKFYKAIMNSLQNMSHQIQFLSIGFSFNQSDVFAKRLLEKFNKYHPRRQWIVSVDPGVNQLRLPWYTENKIRVIKCTAEEFFIAYSKWENERLDDYVFRNKIIFRHANKEKIPIENRLKAKLSNQIRQLIDTERYTNISQEEYYKGEQPSYFVIKQNYDVIRIETLKKTKDFVKKTILKNDGIIPLIALKGSYGTGKSTFSYRLIHELLHDEEFNAVAFEIENIDTLRAIDLVEFFSQIHATNIILVINGIEVHSSFTALLDLRSDLSLEQFTGQNILFLASIRENILEKHKHGKSIKSLFETIVDEPFTADEVEDFITKLNHANIPIYKDARHRGQIVKKIVNEYGGDPFVSLLQLITDGQHNRILNHAYEQLSLKAREAFLYTSLLYRYDILMPANLLMKLVSKNWDSFKSEVLEFDSKNILIQVDSTDQGTSPDIYFKTKHPLVSDHLVKLHLPNEDKLFNEYKKIITHLVYNEYTSKLLVDLLKALVLYEGLGEAKINKLFDIAYTEFKYDPHFCLHYAMNLQHRRTQESLERAINIILVVEAGIDRKNDRLIHRRAVINYKLAQMRFKDGAHISETNNYIKEARELFAIKAIKDPFSSYSFREYLEFEIWYLQKLSSSEEDKIHQMVLIEDLFNRAVTQVKENTHVIHSIRKDYYNKFREFINKDFSEFLDELYANDDFIPYALILEYYHYEEKNNEEDCQIMIEDLEQYSYLDDVAQVLFRHFGRRLYNVNNRVALFSLARNHEKMLLRKDPVRYYYYLYVAEAYNKRFSAAFDHANNIQRKFNVDPVLSEVWRDSLESETIFDGVIERPRNKAPRFKVFDLQRAFPLEHGDYSNINLADGSTHKGKLSFYLYGIKAKIIQENPVRIPS